MRSRTWIVAAALATGLLAAGCGGGEQPSAGGTAEGGAASEAESAASEAESAASEEAAAGGATVAVADADMGSILTDADGRSLYLFTNDTGTESTCYDRCAENWPALTVEGEPSAGEGADSSLLGTTQRTDGSTQVTYNGHPLYYYAADQAPGDVNGQAVGDVWYVVSPAGEAITTS